MRRLVPWLAALAAVLALAPAAHADTFVVTSGADPAEDDINVNGTCNGPPDGCTLREAVLEANATPEPDMITFAPSLTITLVQSTGITVTAPVAITDAEGDVAIERGAGPNIPYLMALDPGASNSLVRGISFRRGPGAFEAQLRVTASTVVLDRLALTRAGTNAIEIAGPASNVSIIGSSITAASGDGIDIAGAMGVSIADSTIAGNGGAGVDIGGLLVHVARTTFYANGEPIRVQPGANGGIVPPHSLQIGPRRADGTLSLTGAHPQGGVLELWNGSPFGASAPSLLDRAGVDAGTFSYVLSQEPAAGSSMAATMTNGGNTSQFALVPVPSDITSPDLLGAVAVSLNEVRVQPSEPVSPGTVELADFRLNMAGRERQLSAVEVAEDGSGILLRSTTPWGHGEAGVLELTSPGAITDPAGNESIAPAPLRVSAAPGDFIPPVASSVRLLPRRMCLVKAARCKRVGSTLGLTASEPGRVKMTVMRGQRQVGVATGSVESGVNRVAFRGRLRNRYLKPGVYDMRIVLEDVVGNESVRPKVIRFRVVRFTEPVPRRR